MSCTLHSQSSQVSEPSSGSPKIKLFLRLWFPRLFWIQVYQQGLGTARDSTEGLDNFRTGHQHRWKAFLDCRVVSTTGASSLSSTSCIFAVSTVCDDSSLSSRERLHWLKDLLHCCGLISCTLLRMRGFVIVRTCTIHTCFTIDRVRSWVQLQTRDHEKYK